MKELINRITARQAEEWQSRSKKAYVSRSSLPKLAKQINDPLIKAIIGPRRSGKSVLATMALAGHRTAYFNFDELPFSDPSDIEDIIPALTATYGETEFYFLDEVQNIKGWELFVNRLQREGRKVIVSGSNAKLLGRELATHLTGRHAVIEVFPFSWQEYLSAKLPAGESFDATKDDHRQLLDQFLREGGYPEVVTGRVAEAMPYLENLINATIARDIVECFHPRRVSELRAVAKWVFSNVGKELTFAKLSGPDDQSGLPTSAITAKKYLDYLQEAYLIALVPRYAASGRDRLRSPKKAYAYDNGAAVAMGFRLSPDNGRLLENLVFTELVKRGQQRNLYYYRSKQSDHEVDFVLKPDLVVEELIEVVWSLDDQDRREKKLANLAAAARETRCAKATIITWMEEGEYKTRDGMKVTAIPFWKWAGR